MKGERFEYEINMLIEAVKNKTDIIEEKIQTIYFDSNRETHFDAVKDSLKIYGVIFKCFFKFTFSSLTSCAIDILLFALFTKVIFKDLSVKECTFIGTALARIISSLFNYSLNKNVVFNNTGKYTIYKYYVLCGLQMMASWALVTGAYNWLHMDTTALKVVVDFLLFLISFQIQRRWVFKNKKRENKELDKSNSKVKLVK